MLDYVLNNSDVDVIYFMVVSGLVGVVGGYSFLKYEEFKGVPRFLTIFLCLVGMFFGGFLAVVGLSAAISVYGALVAALSVCGLMRLVRYGR
ncbi:MAG: hypothetical protein ACKOW9_05495 [Candidatus Paceibacterota bacterium]